MVLFGYLFFGKLVSRSPATSQARDERLFRTEKTGLREGAVFSGRRIQCVMVGTNCESLSGPCTQPAEAVAPPRLWFLGFVELTFYINALIERPAVSLYKRLRTQREKRRWL